MTETAIGPRRVMAVVGTRPDAIKLAPLVRALESSPSLHPVVVATAQHREMLDQVLEFFEIRPNIDLDVMRPDQLLHETTARVLAGMADAIEAERPDVVVVQGDTTTAAASALAAFYARVPVVHLEAGLRTGDLTSPFPEEGNRRVIAAIAALHLAPTPTAAANLLAEGFPHDRVFVSGNTVIDALLWAIDQSPGSDGGILDTVGERRMVLVTAHRRESWGEPLRRLGTAIAVCAAEEPDTVFVLPAHRNPVVRASLLPSLAGRPNVHIVDPLSYPTFCHALRRSHVVITDSGGVQEEAPSLGRPVLVVRDVTERPEGIAAGTARLVGTDGVGLADSLRELLRDGDAYERMANAVNPYGDGAAAPRASDAIAHLLGLGPQPAPFVPGEDDALLRTAAARRSRV